MKVVITLTSVLFGNILVSSVLNLSAMPGSKVVPPHR